MTDAWRAYSAMVETVMRRIVDQHGSMQQRWVPRLHVSWVGEWMQLQWPWTGWGWLSFHVIHICFCLDSGAA